MPHVVAMAFAAQKDTRRLTYGKRWRPAQDNLPAYQFTAPDFLNELSEHAIRNNCIISIGSESGKAYVTILLLREFGCQLRTPLDCGGKRVVVVVPNGELAERRARMIGEHSSAYVYLLLRSSAAANQRSNQDDSNAPDTGGGYADPDKVVTESEHRSQQGVQRKADHEADNAVAHHQKLLENAFIKYECIILEASLYLELLQSPHNAFVDKTCLLIVDDCHLGVSHFGGRETIDRNAGSDGGGLLRDSVSVSYAAMFKQLQKLLAASPHILKHLRLIGMTAAFVQRYPQPAELERFVLELEHSMLDSPARTTSTMIAVNCYGNIPTVTIVSYMEHALCTGAELFSSCPSCDADTTAFPTCGLLHKTAPVALHHRILALLGELKVSLGLCLQINQAASRNAGRQHSSSSQLTASAAPQSVAFSATAGLSTTERTVAANDAGSSMQKPDASIDLVESGQLGTIKIVQAAVQGLYLNYKELGPLALHQTALVVISGLQDSLVKNLLHRDMRKLLQTALCRLRTLCAELEVAYELSRGATTEKLLKMCTPKVLKLLELLRQQFNEKKQNPMQNQQYRSSYGGRSNRGRLTTGGRNPGNNQQQLRRIPAHHRHLYYPNCVVLVRRRYASWALHRIISLFAAAKSPPPFSPHSLFKPGLLVGTSAAGATALLSSSSGVGGGLSAFDGMLLSTSVATDDSIKFAADLIDTEKSVMSPKAVEEVLRYYRYGKHNVLIATSVMLDCGRALQLTPSSAVISFDTVTNYKAYMYCKGCVRAKGGQLVLMTPQAQLELTRRALDIFKATDAVLMSRCGHSLRQPEFEGGITNVSDAEKTSDKYTRANTDNVIPAPIKSDAVADAEPADGSQTAASHAKKTRTKLANVAQTSVTGDVFNSFVSKDGSSISAASRLRMLLPPYCPSRQQQMQHQMQFRPGEPPRMPLGPHYMVRPEYQGGPPTMVQFHGNQYAHGPAFRPPPPSMVNFPVSPRPPPHPMMQSGSPYTPGNHAGGPGTPSRGYRQQRPFRNASAQYRGGRPPLVQMPYMMPPPPPYMQQQRHPTGRGRSSRMPVHNQRNAFPVAPHPQYPVMMPHAPPGYYGPRPADLRYRQPFGYNGPPPPHMMYVDPYHPQTRVVMMGCGDASGVFRYHGVNPSFDQSHYYAARPPQHVPLFAEPFRPPPPLPSPLQPYQAGHNPYAQPSDMIPKPNITMHNAIAIVNRYCANLPSDSYALLTPVWHAEQTARLTWNQVHNVITQLKHDFGIDDLSYWECVRAAAAVTNESDMVEENATVDSTGSDEESSCCTLFRVELQLPINSPCREYIVHGPWMPSLLQAKQAVAQIMCIYLHRRDELDKLRLLPVTKDAWRRDVVRELRRVTIDPVMNRVVPLGSASSTPALSAKPSEQAEIDSSVTKDHHQTTTDTHGIDINSTAEAAGGLDDDDHDEDEEDEGTVSSIDEVEVEDIVDVEDDEVVTEDDSDADVGEDKLTCSPSPKKSAMRNSDESAARTSKLNSAAATAAQPPAATTQQQVSTKLASGDAAPSTNVPACAAYEPRMSSTKRRRYYTKRFPVVFNQTFAFKPSSGPSPPPLVSAPEISSQISVAASTSMTCSLYSIDMYLHHPLPPEQNVRGRKLFHPELATRSFGILVYAGASLPIVNAFNIYDRSGEVSVRLRPITNELVITAAQFELLTKFHKQIFSGQVLNMQRYSLQFDMAKSTCTYLIVPLRRTRNDPSNARIRSVARQVRFVDKLDERFAAVAGDVDATDESKKVDVIEADAHVTVATAQQMQHIGPRFNDHELANTIGLDHVTKSRLPPNLSGNDESGYCGAMCSSDVCFDFKQSNDLTGRKSVNTTHVTVDETRSSIAHPERSFHNYTRPSPVCTYDRIREVKLDEVAEMLSWAQIDWDLVKKLDSDLWQQQQQQQQSGSSGGKFEVHARPEEERRKMKFDRRDWEDAVVIPWYRNKDQMMAYYVEDVCDWMTPMSLFPDEQYKTFDEYYRIKYGLEIQHKSQPLIDVDHISTRMNLLLPRFLSRKGHALNESLLKSASAGTSSGVVTHLGGGRDNRNRQILIPELCSVHPLPASLWRKAICLPVILYRIQALLLMDELRVRLHNEAGIGVRYPRDGQWPPLCYGWSYAEKVLQLKSGNTPPVAADDDNETVKDAALEDTSSENLQQFLDSQRLKKTEPTSQQTAVSAAKPLKPATITPTEAAPVTVQQSKAESNDSGPAVVPTPSSESDTFTIGEWSIDDVSAEIREKMEDDSLLLLKRDVSAESSMSKDNILMLNKKALPPLLTPSSSNDSGSSAVPTPSGMFHRFETPQMELGTSAYSMMPRGVSSQPTISRTANSSTSIFALPSGGKKQSEEWPLPYDHKSLFADAARAGGNSTDGGVTSTATSVPVRITGSGWKDLPWSDLEYEIMEKVRQQKLRKKAARAAGIPYVAEQDELIQGGDGAQQPPNGAKTVGDEGVADDDYDGDELNLKYEIGFDSAQVGGVQKISKHSATAQNVAVPSAEDPPTSGSRKQRDKNKTTASSAPSVFDNVSYLVGGAAGGANATTIGAPPPPIVEEIDDDDDDDVGAATEKMNKLKLSKVDGLVAKSVGHARVLQHVTPIEKEAKHAETKPPPVASKLQFISGDDALTPDLLSSIRDDMSKYEAGEQLDELKGLYDDDDDEEEEAVEDEGAKQVSGEVNNKNPEASSGATTATKAAPALSSNTLSKPVVPSSTGQQYSHTVVDPAVLFNVDTATSGKNNSCNFVLSSVCQMRATYAFISSLDSRNVVNNDAAGAYNSAARIAMRLFEKQLADYNFDALSDVKLHCCTGNGGTGNGRTHAELQLLVELLRRSAMWCGTANVHPMTQLKQICKDIDASGSDSNSLHWCRKLLAKIYAAASRRSGTRSDFYRVDAARQPSTNSSSLKAEFGEAMPYNQSPSSNVASRAADDSLKSEPSSSQPVHEIDDGALNVDRIVVQPAEPPFSFDHYDHQTCAEELAAASAKLLQKSAATAAEVSSEILPSPESSPCSVHTLPKAQADADTSGVSSASAATQTSDPASSVVPSEGRSWLSLANIKRSGIIGRTLPTDYVDTKPPPPGPSPAMLLFAFTASNANDGINLERLETVGDSFLKYSITVYLYLRYRGYHEGKLSYARSLLVSNSHLYKLGERKALGQYITANKFEPTDNWLPPCYIIDEKNNNNSKSTTSHHHYDELKQSDSANSSPTKRARRPNRGASNRGYSNNANDGNNNGGPSPNLRTHHCVNDKTVADCVEALVGAVLVSSGTRDALALMNWLGLPTASFCLPKHTPLMMLPDSSSSQNQAADTAASRDRHCSSASITSISTQSSGVVNSGISRQPQQLETLYCGLDEFESRLGYTFVNKQYIVQAFTHATYHINRLTDCYQRLEFLGDAVLDYVITRHLFEDKRCFLPGELTDLRSALVNNAMFASLAVRYDFHKYLKLMSPQILRIIDSYVRKEKQRWQQHKQKQNNSGITTANYDELIGASAVARVDRGYGQEHGIMQQHRSGAPGDVDDNDDANDIVGDDDLFEAEETTVPKVLGDVFESIAGAIYMDSGMSLDAVWRVYFSMMHQDIEECCRNIPKSPVRALLEAEPDNVKFFKPERVANGKVRIEVQIFDKGRFVGVGRNYRAAKCTAARQALNYLREMGFIDEEEDVRNSGVGTVLADED